MADVLATHAVQWIVVDGTRELALLVRHACAFLRLRDTSTSSSSGDAIQTFDWSGCDGVDIKLVAVPDAVLANCASVAAYYARCGTFLFPNLVCDATIFTDPASASSESALVPFSHSDILSVLVSHCRVAQFPPSRSTIAIVIARQCHCRQGHAQQRPGSRHWRHFLVCYSAVATGVLCILDAKADSRCICCCHHCR